jgi:hypothetical protein
MKFILECVESLKIKKIIFNVKKKQKINFVCCQVSYQKYQNQTDVFPSLSLK